MQRRNGKLRVIHMITQLRSNWDGLTGRISGEMIRKFLPDFMNRVNYVSGPGGMVEELVHTLTTELEIPARQVKTEYFPRY